MNAFKFADVDKQCANCPELKHEDIAKLDEWQRKEPHLPAPLHPIETALFLQRSRYSIEAAKQRIDKYYTFRTHCPELFDRRDPFDPDVQRFLGICVITALPDLTPDGYLVIYTRLLDGNAALFEFNTFLKVLHMIIELTQKQRGCHAGVVVIIDLETLSVAHALKLVMSTAQKCIVFLQKLLPMRFKSMHFVNSVPFIEMIMSVVRPYLKKDFPVKVHFGDNTSVFSFVPKYIMPIECGGSGLSAIEYYQKVTRKNIEDNAAYFKIEARQLVDETKRLVKRTNIDDLLGIEGTFKKLNVD